MNVSDYGKQPLSSKGSRGNFYGESRFMTSFGRKQKQRVHKHFYVIPRLSLQQALRTQQQKGAGSSIMKARFGMFQIPVTDKDFKMSRVCSEVFKRSK